jgi:hypothetical protein
MLMIPNIREFRDSRNFGFWDNQEVNRSLGINVPNRKDELVLVHDLAGNFAIQNPGEQSCHALF